MITLADLHFTKEKYFGLGNAYVCSDPILPGIEWKLWKDTAGKWAATSKGYFSPDFDTLKDCKAWLASHFDNRTVISMGEPSETVKTALPIGEIGIGAIVEYKHREFYDVVNILVCDDNAPFLYCVDEYNCPHVVLVSDLTNAA